MAIKHLILKSIKNKFSLKISRGASKYFNFKNYFSLLLFVEKINNKRRFTMFKSYQRIRSFFKQFCRCYLKSYISTFFYTKNFGVRNHTRMDALGKYYTTLCYFGGWSILLLLIVHADEIKLFSKRSNRVRC